MINEINEQYDVIYAYQAPYSKVKELIFDRDVLFTSTCPNYLVDNNLTDNSSLKIIATPSTGVNHISLKNKNIKIISIKNSKVIEEIYASSEFSFTLLLALYKKLNMGFHKRWLMNESLIDMYRNRGINAVAEWVNGADALMAEEGLASDIVDLLHEEKFRPTETWNKVSKLISDASIKKGFKK